MSDITRQTSYDLIADLDPLGFDSYAGELPVHNAAGHIGHIATEYGRLLEVADASIEDLDGDQATAALRDLDFIAGSLLRHGAVEIAEQSIAQRVLSQLADRAGTVPRGTVFTYAASNPQGVRARSFTGATGENLFIDAVRRGIKHLDDCMANVAAGIGGNTEALVATNTNMQGMVDSMITVKRYITPEFFTFEMRPYFESLHVDGKTFAGTGGAQMQLTAIDRMLWGVDSEDENYQAYYIDNVRYLTPDHREAIAEFERSTDGHSLITLIEKGEVHPEAILPTRALIKTIRKFRYPHRKVAQDNFALRSDGAVGSGRYTPAILTQLIALNDAAAGRLERMHVEE